jgi:hypothetical protein
MEKLVRWVTGEPAANADVRSSTEDKEPNMPVNEPGQVTRRTGDPQVVNDAEAYGVVVEEAQVEPGTTYWQVRRVHHLTPDENNGRHHIYIEALTPDGKRAFQSRARITWDGGEQTVTVDKPLPEPGTNFPMWKWQVCTVEMLGMPSDKVRNLHTAHPDEPNPDGSTSGNTLFHHSFLIEYQQVTAAGETTGNILGRVKNASPNLPVVLLQDGQEVARQAVAEDGTFTFQDVEAGTYTVRAGSVGQEVAVETGKTTDVTLALPLHDSVIEGVVENGKDMTLRLVKDGAVLVEGVLGASGAFRLKALAAGDYFVQVVRPGQTEPVAIAGPITVDGTDRKSVTLTVPLEPVQTGGSPLDHYVLFGPPDRPETKVLLIALAPTIARQRLAFGFQPSEAARAATITIVGDASLVPEDVEHELAKTNANVRRVAGSVENILAAFAE